MLQDLRLAVRSIRRQPSFALLAMLIIGLGAAANAAVLAVVNAVLLKPLPYERPDRLVAVAPGSFFSAADADFVNARSHWLIDAASSSPGWRMSLLGVGEPIQIVAARPSLNLLSMLGVRPVLGRLFAAGDDAAGRRVAILSHALWRDRFGGDPRVVGRTVMLDGAQREVVGVLEPRAGVIDPEAQAWVPFDAGTTFVTSRSSVLYGRLADDAAPDAASSELEALRPEMERLQSLRFGPGQTMRVVPLADVIVGDVRSPLLLMLACVALLVLLTATNVGTLLLGRQVGRQRDTAVRAALGASGLRLARERVTEALMLAVGGAISGLALARTALPAVTGLLPRELPRIDEIAVDPFVAALVLLATVAAVLLLGLAPTLVPAGVNQPLLRQGAQTESRGSRALLDTLVVSQVVFAIVLGFAASLVGRSLWRLQHVDPGFDPAPVLTLRLQPSGERYRAPGSSLRYYREITERIGRLPGVEAVGLTNHLPLSGYSWMTTFVPDGQQASSPAARIGWRMVDGDYFRAMRIPLLAGRALSRSDDAKAPLVTVINEAAARRYFGSIEAALGRTAGLSGATGDQRVEIVGVVGDVRHQSIAIAPDAEIYRPIAQTFATAMTLTIRTAGSPAGQAAAVRAAVWEIDPDVAIAGMAPMTTAVRENLGRPRMMAALLLIFAATGLTIVVCGVYGVVAYSVRRREREIGIRVALGAAQGRIRALVLRQGVGYAAAGLAIGVPFALAVARLMQGLLFGIGPYDPSTVAGLSVVIAIAVLAATIAPARRAVRITPGAMMRGE